MVEWFNGSMAIQTSIDESTLWEGVSKLLTPKKNTDQIDLSPDEINDVYVNIATAELN